MTFTVIIIIASARNDNYLLSTNAMNEKVIYNKRSHLLGFDLPILKHN